MLSIVTVSVEPPVNINRSSKGVTLVVGLTVIVKICDGPSQLIPKFVKVGVTVISVLIADETKFSAVNVISGEESLLVPLSEDNPIFTPPVFTQA